MKGLDCKIIKIKEGEAENIKALDLSRLSPNQYRYDYHLPYLRLGIFLLSSGNLESGRSFIEKTLQIFPSDPVANSFFGGKVSTFFWWEGFWFKEKVADNQGGQDGGDETGDMKTKAF